MGRNAKLKIALDILMTLFMLLLMDASYMGVLWHEILGVSVFILFIAHIALNREWVGGVSKSLLSGRLRTRTKVLYALDVLLGAAMGATVLSGVLISKKLFSFLSVNNVVFWDALHTSSAYLGLILISVHLGFHWKALLCAFKKMAGIRKDSGARTLALRILALGFAVLGVRASFVNHIGQKLLSPFASESAGGGEQALSQAQESSGEEKTVRASAVSAGTQDAGTESLEDYLSSLYCTGCHRHCPLISPQCSVGENQALKAEEDYYASAADGDDGLTGEDPAGSGENRGDTGSSGTEDGADGSAKREAGTDKSPFSPLTDTLPVMGLYVAGTYYTLKFKRENDK